MIPVKLFQRMITAEEEFLHNPTDETSQKVLNEQESVGWPWKASKEQIDYWNKIRRT